MRELSIEQRLVAHIKTLGGVALKGENVAGFPDRIVLMPGGNVYFVETKQPKGQLSERQIEWGKDLMAMSMTYQVVWSRQDLKDFLHIVEANLYCAGLRA